ncbi:hypothetical protein HDU98_005202 [Podochytrium sp. JEL0797]|nr:hypothetical protein HDU98_005202 [Podochytrium sp. JEL0797]
MPLLSSLIDKLRNRQHKTSVTTIMADYRSASSPQLNLTRTKQEEQLKKVQDQVENLIFEVQLSSRGGKGF